MRRILVPHEFSARPPPVAGVVHELHGLTMGTTWSVRLVTAAHRNIESLRIGIQQQLDRVVAQMSTWESDSILSRYNRAPADTWHQVPDEFLYVLKYALQIAKWSDGAYDPSAGPLVNIWGFGPEPKRTARPDADNILRARVRVGWQRIQIDATQRVLQPGDAYLDFSAIAKGFGVDQVSRHLQQRGIDNHLVEVGGELRGNGMKPDGLPWWVEVERPLQRNGDIDRKLLQNVIALHGLSIATSGDYRKFFDTDDARYCHTIDPRTGEPIAHGVAAVTVVHRDCITADAVSTALNVLGHETGLALANRDCIPALFVVRTEQGFTEYMSDEFRALLQ